MSDGLDDELYMTPDRIKKILSSLTPSDEVDEVLSPPVIGRIRRKLRPRGDHVESYIEDLRRYVGYYLCGKKQIRNSPGWKQRKAKLERIANISRDACGLIGCLDEKELHKLLEAFRGDDGVCHGDLHDAASGAGAIDPLETYYQIQEFYGSMACLFDVASRIQLKRGNQARTPEELLVGRMASSWLGLGFGRPGKTPKSHFYRFAHHLLHVVGYTKKAPEVTIRRGVELATLGGFK